MRLRRLLLLTTFGLAAAAPARADTVREWMEFAQKALASSPGGPLSVTTVSSGEGDYARSKAALAMFEAVNASDRRYRSYVGLPIGSAGADQQAAGITAATAELMTALGGARPAWGVRIGSGSLPTAVTQVTPDWNEWARR